MCRVGEVVVDCRLVHCDAGRSSAQVEGEVREEIIEQLDARLVEIYMRSLGRKKYKTTVASCVLVSHHVILGCFTSCDTRLFGMYALSSFACAF